MAIDLETSVPHAHARRVHISLRDLDDDELSAHVLGLRAALLTAADEDADDATLEDIARSIKDCRAEMDRRGLE